MKDIIEVFVENNSTSHFVNVGSSLEELLVSSGIKMRTNIIAAFSNNRIKELDYKIYMSQSIRFVEFDSSEGRRVYARSLFFLLEKAVVDLFGDVKLRMMHPVGRGFYCELVGMDKPSDEQIQMIKNRMIKLIKADLPIVRNTISLDKAKEHCIKHNQTDKLMLLETKPRFYVSFFNLGGLFDYFYGAMVPSTSYLKVFDAEMFCDGLVVLMPDRRDPSVVEQVCVQSKLYSVFRDYNYWGDILGVANVGALNKKILDSKDGELIKISEALHEKTFSRIADDIHDKRSNGDVKLVLIAGPSSSGKTSSSKRLSVQLQVLGLEPFAISLDDYFVERERTPRDKQGNYDFEALEAVDIEEFNKDLNLLFEGEEVTLPRFDFITGRRSHDGKTVRLNEKSVLIIEGIHALNPKLVPHIDKKVLYKIYASALTTLSVDCGVAIHTTDNRLLRRIVRDFKYRGRDAYTTIKGWQSVRAGEDKHIFPYQEQADVMINTALIYELAVLAPIARPLLNRVRETVPEYAEALRLLKFLDYFVEVDTAQIPPTSIIREFIGGSSFEY